MLLRILPSHLRRILSTDLVKCNYKHRHYNKFIQNEISTRSISFPCSINIRHKSTDDKSHKSQTSDELSQNDMKLLTKDPDSFGTLSTVGAMNETNSEKSNDIDSNGQSEREPHLKSTEMKTITIGERIERLEKLVENKQIEEAVKIFLTEMVEKEQIHMPIKTYIWLIDECLNNFLIKEAFDLFEYMKNRTFKFSFETIEKLILASETYSNSLKKTNSLRKEMLRRDFRPNEKIYNALIRNYIRSATAWKTGLELAQEMIKNGFQYENDTMNYLMKAYSYDKNNGFYQALELWYELKCRDEKLNVHGFNEFLQCIRNCENYNVNQLLETLDKIKAKYPTDSTAVRFELVDDGRPCLLDDPSKIGTLFPLENISKPEHHLLILGGLSNILNKINKCDIVPNEETILRLLEIIPNTNAAEEKVSTLVQKYNIIPTIECYKSLLNRRCLRQDFRGSMEIIRAMYDSDSEVDIISYGLVSLSCKTSAEAEQFFDELSNNDIKLHIHIVDAMLKNAITSKDNDYAIKILRTTKLEEITPSSDTIQMVCEYQKESFRNMFKRRTSNKRHNQMRNECFRIQRECKQWLKHFNIFVDKNANENENTDDKQKPKIKTRILSKNEHKSTEL